MENSKATKRALIASALSLFLCTTMLIGTTFAWFTDTVTSSGNVIKSGTFAVGMEWSKGTEDPNTDAVWHDASKEPIFKNDKWEAGYTEARHIKISNNGTLALKYEIDIVPDENVSQLADVIDVYYIQGGKQIADRDAFENLNLKPIGTLADFLNGDYVARGDLSETEKDIATIVLKMKEDAGNYPDKPIGSGFDIVLRATQASEEEDSFGSDYDAGADFATNVGDSKELIKAIEDGGNVRLENDIKVPSSLKFTGDKKVEIDLNGNEIKSDKNVNIIDASGSANVTVKNGTLSVDDNESACAIYAQDSAKVIIENCEINQLVPSGAYAVTTNGTKSKNTTITIKNSNISSNQGFTCYFPAGKILLQNCNVSGAVIIGGGDVTLDGGTYTAAGFPTQTKIWHVADTVKYLNELGEVGHMGDSVLIMDRRSGYSMKQVTVKNITFNTEVKFANNLGKDVAYAIKYFDFNKVAGAERIKHTIENNIYNNKLADGTDPLMFIDSTGATITQ